LTSQSEKKTWSLYYNKKYDFVFLDLIATLINQATYLKEIIKNKPQSVVEIGTGRGLHAIFLSLFIPKVIGIDAEKKLVKNAKRLNKKLHGRAEFLLMDAFNLGFKERSSSICCSQGFFEHFSDNGINALIKEQIRLSELVIFSVPSSYYPTKNKGDERLMSDQEWRLIINQPSVKTQYYGFCFDTSKGILGNLRSNSVRRAFSSPRKAQICVLIRKQIV
jgi:SAM-dependent methyltransferase